MGFYLCPLGLQVSKEAKEEKLQVDFGAGYSSDKMMSGIYKVGILGRQTVSLSTYAGSQTCSLCMNFPPSDKDIHVT